MTNQVKERTYRALLHAELDSHKHFAKAWVVGDAVYLFLRPALRRRQTELMVNGMIYPVEQISYRDAFKWKYKREMTREEYNMVDWEMDQQGEGDLPEGVRL